MREALKGRGRSRRDAESTLRGLEMVDRFTLVPLVLAVRDELAREDQPPRGLSGRADALLTLLATEALPRPTGGESRRRSGNGRGREAGSASNGRRAPAKKGASSREIAASASRSRRGTSSGRGAPTGGRRSFRLLRGLLDLAPDAVLTLRADEGVGLWNRAGVEITGRRRQDLVQRGARSLFSEENLLEGLLPVLEKEGVADPLEAVVVGASGEKVPVRVHGSVLDLPSAPGREPDRYLLILHDLTEVHRIRSRLIETEKLSAMAKIAGSVAHEFRNPLNSLFLSTDLLEDELTGTGAEKTILPTLTAIREEIERLNQIITHYLSLSKVASNAPEMLDLGRISEEFSEEWRERATERGVELRVKVHEGDLAVSADPNQVRRVLVNLVENAFDALSEAAEAEQAPPAPVVTLVVRPLRRTVKIVVRDNGPGISDDQCEQVFEPFFTSKNQGSGLGLYLVREILLAHGGAISLASTGGRGTSVAMHWPRAEGGGA